MHVHACTVRTRAHVCKRDTRPESGGAPGLRPHWPRKSASHAPCVCHAIHALQRTQCMVARWWVGRVHRRSKRGKCVCHACMHARIGGRGGALIIMSWCTHVAGACGYGIALRRGKVCQWVPHPTQCSMSASTISDGTKLCADSGMPMLQCIGTATATCRRGGGRAYI